MGHLPVRWVYVGLAWLLVTLLFILQNVVGAVAVSAPVDVEWAVAHEVIYWGLWAALTPLIVAWARRYPFGRGAGPRTWLAHLSLAVVLAPTQTALTYGLHLLGLLALGVLPATAAPEWLEAREGAFLVISLTGLWKYAVVVGLYYAFDYYYRYRRQEQQGARLAVRAAQLESRWAEARLDALRMQLQPHFLFNTLNSIAVLNREAPARANRMLLRLSDLLRTALEVRDREVPLHRELEIARQYIAIQEIRYEERLRVDVEVRPEVENADVPAFLLQPLLENAVRHGVERDVGAQRIRLAAWRQDGRLRIEVENPLPPEGNCGDERVGIGLANIRERLEHAFGPAHAFEAGPSPARGTFLVTIDIPFRTTCEE